MISVEVLALLFAYCVELSRHNLRTQSDLCHIHLLNPRFSFWTQQMAHSYLRVTVENDAQTCYLGEFGKICSDRNQGKTYHHFVKGHPTVRRKVLQHGHQELQTAIPVAQQQHHANQIEDAHHRTGQVIGHVKDLSVKIRAHYI